MKSLFILNFLASFSIFIFLIWKIFKHQDNEKKIRISIYFFFIGLLYLLISIFSFLWFFNFLEYSLSDFSMIYLIVIFFQSLLLFRIIYLFSHNRKLFYFLWFYLISVAAMFVSIVNFSSLFLLISFLLLLIFFLNLSVRKDVYSKVGYVGIFYSLIGLIFQVFVILGIGNLYVFNFVLTIVFSILILVFIKDLEENPPEKCSCEFEKERSYFFTLMSHLLFIIVLTNFVFIGTIAIHEFGHFGLSKFYDCESRKIVYEEGLFHTEILCRDGKGSNVVLWGGVSLPFILAIILFFIGGKFMKEVGLLMVGFNFLAVLRDLRDLGVSNNLVFLSIFFGMVFLIAGLIFLAKSRAEEDLFSIKEVAG